MSFVSIPVHRQDNSEKVDETLTAETASIFSLKNVLLDKICVLCLSVQSDLVPVAGLLILETLIPIMDLLKAVSFTKCAYNDCSNKKICNLCLKKLAESYTFEQTCKKNLNALIEYHKTRDTPNEIEFISGSNRSEIKVEYSLPENSEDCINMTLYQCACNKLFSSKILLENHIVEQGPTFYLKDGNDTIHNQWLNKINCMLKMSLYEDWSGFCLLCFEDQTERELKSLDMNVVILRQSNEKENMFLLRDFLQMIIPNLDQNNLGANSICKCCLDIILPLMSLIKSHKDKIQAFKRCLNGLYKKTADIDEEYLKRDEKKPLLLVVDLPESTDDDASCDDLDNGIIDDDVRSKKRTKNKIKNSVSKNCDLNSEGRHKVPSHFCDHCHRSFPTKRAISTHIRNYHLNDTCYICNKVVKSQYFKRHLENHKKKDVSLICGECEKPFESQEQLKNHENTHSSSCDVCRTVHTDGTHTQCGHKRETCPICGKTFKKLKVHMKMKHGRRRGKESDKFPCDRCDLEFASRYKKIKHMAAEHSCHRGKISDHVMQMCDICGLEKPKYLMYHHVKYVHSSIDCHICGKTLKRASLNSHIRIKHSKDHVYKKIPCDHCEKTFQNLSFKEAHVNSVHLKIRPYVCSQCGRGYHNNYSLQVHKKTHLGLRPFGCTLCDTKLVTKKALEKHMRIHTGERPYSCGYCGRKFISSSELQRHKQSLHERTNDHECEVCGKVFPTRISLKKHIIKVHNINIGELKFKPVGVQIL